MISQEKHLDHTPRFVLTANRLLDGRVVWLTSQGCWGIMIEEAQFFSTKEEAEQKLQQITKTDSTGFLIDLHYTEIKNVNLPMTVREKIRAFGPTNHPEFNPRSI